MEANRTTEGSKLPLYNGRRGVAYARWIRKFKKYVATRSAAADDVSATATLRWLDVAFEPDSAAELWNAPVIGDDVTRIQRIRQEIKAQAAELSATAFGHDTPLVSTQQPQTHSTYEF